MSMGVSLKFVIGGCESLDLRRTDTKRLRFLKSLLHKQNSGEESSEPGFEVFNEKGRKNRC